MKLINFILGECTLKACGTFPERVLNIAKENSVFIRNITFSDNALFFTVSDKGARRLLSLPLPDSITLTKEKSSGLMSILSRTKSRRLLFISPAIIFLLLFLSTNIIWHVNIVDADPVTEKRLLDELKKLGVKRGALKFTIDSGDVKDRLLIADETLLWAWVDIKGSSAIVRYAKRDMPPSVFDENSFYNIYSSHDALITRMSTTNGTPKVMVGDTVLKGQLLIEGSIAKNAEEIKHIHASGEIFGTVWEEKTVVIDKKEEIRTPTGAKKEHLSIFFSNFQLNFFINSSILYTNYDIIISNRSLPLLPITFTKTVYNEVGVTYKDNNIDLLISAHTEEFTSYLSSLGFSVNDIQSYTQDAGDKVHVTIRALCEEPIGIERRMYVGENNSVSDN